MPYQNVLDDLESRQPAILEWLKSFLRIPSVSADPSFEEGMHEARRFLVNRLNQIGLDNVQLLEGGGEPAVYGEWCGAPGKPTLMVYGHYDVQPADPIELWATPPFEPTVVGDRIYGRGTSDVKGSTTIALEVIASFLAVQGGCPVNIKVFLEGEEETGSPSLRALATRHRELLKADAVISADGGRASPSVPTVNTGARGVAQLEVRLRTASKDLHSGRYGGAVRNAVHEMARLAASLHGVDGGVAVDGFYDQAVQPTAKQRADTAAFPYDEAAYFTDVHGVAHGEPDYSARERVTLRPSLDINGLWGGYSGSGLKTIIPCEASAKITARVVEGQDASEVIKAVLEHLQERCPAGCQLDVITVSEGSPASTIPPDHPLVRAAEAVLRRETGREPIHVRLGATVPVTSLFKETLGINTLMFGYNLPDEDVHAPNEFFRLTSMHDGAKAWALLLSELGNYSPASFVSR